jgi:hypothetical protein
VLRRYLQAAAVVGPAGAPASAPAAAAGLDDTAEMDTASAAVDGDGLEASVDETAEARGAGDVRRRKSCES